MLPAPCYSVAVTVRLAFAIAATAVLAVGVYLLVEVRSAPAIPAPTPATATAAAREPAPVRPAPTIPAAPTWRPQPQLAADPPEAGAPRPQLAGMNRFMTPGARAALTAIQRANPKMDALMHEANEAYDHEDYDRAMDIARKVLSKEPNNVRMLRVMVSSACFQDDSVTAQKYYNLLPPHDREQMKARCGDKTGVTFTDPP